MNAGTGALLIALLAAPVSGETAAPLVPQAVLAEDLGPETAPAKTTATDDPGKSLTSLQPAVVRLFAALESGSADENVDRLVSAAVIELDMNCPRVNEYQIYRFSERARTLKIKCAERPVFAVTLGTSGEAYVSGGDGTIGQMRLDDGPIRTVMGLTVEDYMASTQDAPPLLTDEEETPFVMPRVSFAPDWVSWLVWGLGLAVATIMVLIFLRDRRRSKTEFARWRDLDSEAKDQLVAESEEIYPNIYRHPSGVFIARGRRGKRRLFPSLILAYLYRSRSYKFFEIR